MSDRALTRYLYFLYYLEKHGVMPKKCYPETFSNESSRQMNNMLKSKMREFSYALYNATKNDATDEAIKTMINDQMKIIYRYGIQLVFTNNVCVNLKKFFKKFFL